ncbi:MAG TPA: cytochrome P450 [Thermoanaerobaculia bacterium]|jgi:cytochrome P450|nr:cytochrome P450 [Thermoanaerobaculia bacterium]
MTTKIERLALERQGSRIPPRPRGYPLVGVLPRLMSDPVRFCTRMMLQYNDLVRLDLGVGSIYLVTLPEHMHQVLVENNDNYWKGDVFERTRFLFGNGLVVNEGESWRRQRRLMQPAFAHRRVASLVPIMTDVVEQRLAGWEAASETGEPLEIGREMMSLTLGIIVKTMFSLSIDDRELRVMSRCFNTALEQITLRMATYFLPEWVPLPGQRARRQAVATLDEMVYRIIRERRESGREFDDLLSMLLSARDTETGEGMTDREIRDEVMVTLFGGYEATADALTWTWFLLGEHPHVDDRVREEVASVLGGRAPSFEDLAGLTYTAQVAQEAMRLYPPFWFYNRTAIGDDEIGGYRIPAGAQILLCPYATHRHPEFWEVPEAFRPERFEPAQVASRPRHAYVPFGTGPRMCIGRHLAMLEMQLILALVAQRYRPRLAPGWVVVPKVGTSLRAKGGMWMIPERA